MEYKWKAFRQMDVNQVHNVKKTCSKFVGYNPMWGLVNMEELTKVIIDFSSYEAERKVLQTDICKGHYS